MLQCSYEGRFPVAGIVRAIAGREGKTGCRALSIRVSPVLQGSGLADKVTELRRSEDFVTAFKPRRDLVTAVSNRWGRGGRKEPQ